MKCPQCGGVIRSDGTCKCDDPGAGEPAGSPDEDRTLYDDDEMEAVLINEEGEDYPAPLLVDPDDDTEADPIPIAPVVTPSPLRPAPTPVAPAPGPTAAEVASRQTDRIIPGPPAAKFEVIRELGRGGFGVVWLVRRKKRGIDGIEDLAAVKRLVASDLSYDEAIKRFLREVEAVRHLNHQSIVRLLDFDQDEHGPYLVMEYVEGRSLQEVIDNNQPVPVDEVIQIGVELCKALHYAHTRSEKVVHRDIKPTNVILSEEEGLPKILDFGLARQGTESERGGYSMPSGSWDYASPEQRLGQPIDHRTDIFSLGATLYHLASRRSPALRIDTDRVPAVLKPIIEKATAEEPQRRYFTMEDMQSALTRALEAPQPAPEGPSASAEAGDSDLCPLCGEHPREGYRYCPKTGQGLFRVCPGCKGENPLKVQFCIQCGADIAAVDRALEFMRHAAEREEEKDYERALQELDKACDLLRSHSSARNAFREAQKSRDRVAKAIEKRKSICEWVENKIAASEFDEAEQTLKTVMEVDETYPRYQSYMERIPRLKREHFLKLSKKLFEEWNLEAAYQNAQTAASITGEGRREAERQFAFVRRKRADFRDLANRVGRRMKARRYQETLDLIDAASEQFPNHPRLEVWAEKARGQITRYESLLDQGNEELRKGKWKQAESFFRGAHQIVPAGDRRAEEGIRRARTDQYDALLGRARQEEEAGKWKSALALFERARAVIPDDNRAETGIAEITARRRRVRRRRRVLLAFVGLLVLAFFAHGPVAAYLAGSGEVETAEAMYGATGKVMINGPAVATALANHYLKLGHQEHEAGDFPAANTRYEKALAFDGENVGVLEALVINERFLAIRARDQNDLNEAYAWIRRAQEMAGRIRELEVGVPEKLKTDLEWIEKNEVAIRERIRAALAGSLDPDPTKQPRFSSTPAFEVRWKAAPKAGVTGIFLLDGEERRPCRRTGEFFTSDVVLEKEGAETLTFLMVDKNGIEQEFEQKVVFDQSPPVITLEKDEIVTRKSELPVLVKVEDASGRDFPIEVWAEPNDGSGDVPAKFYGGDQWKLVLRLPEGLPRRTYLVNAKDPADNRAEVRELTLIRDDREVSVDLRPDPAAKLTADGEGVYHTRKSRITLVAETPLRDISLKEGSTTGLRITDNKGTHTFPLERLPEWDDEAGLSRIRCEVELFEGLNRIELVIADSEGDENRSQELALSLDLKAPRFLVPELGALAGCTVCEVGGTKYLLGRRAPALRIEVEEEALDSVTSDGMAVAVKDGAVSLPVKPGPNRYVLAARDLAGNVAEPVEIAFEFHALPDTVSIGEGGSLTGPGGMAVAFIPGGAVELPDLGVTEEVKPFLIGRDEAPVTKLTCAQAVAWARERDMGLPTEARWYRAATCGVTGLEHMKDGVTEWVLPDHPTEASTGITRGGATGLGAHLDRRDGWAAETANEKIGFRCVIELVE